MMLDTVKIYREPNGAVKLTMTLQGTTRTLQADIGPFESPKEALDFAVVIETSLDGAVDRKLKSLQYDLERARA